MNNHPDESRILPLLSVILILLAMIGTLAYFGYQGVSTNFKRYYPPLFVITAGTTFLTTIILHKKYQKRKSQNK